jgi:uncharacterized protein
MKNVYFLSDFTSFTFEQKLVFRKNVMDIETYKSVRYHNWFDNAYFLRTVQQQEIDYLEDRDGALSAYEFKWNQDKTFKPPITFSKAYPGSSYDLITPKSFEAFVGIEKE